MTKQKIQQGGMLNPPNEKWESVPNARVEGVPNSSNEKIKQKKGCTISKPARRVKISSGMKFNLSDRDYYYCPVHGKCPAVEGTWNHGAFFCEECGMIKTLDVYGNCHGLADVEVIV